MTNAEWEKIWTKKATDSIEHIWAQSNAPEKQKHRLGNLVLLPPYLNSKLQAKKATVKSQDYRNTGLRIAKEVADLIDSHEGWNKNTINDREKTLLEWASKEWADG